MVRIIIKGGVWRNTEDEILKAAISKYGKNQWARISSLLVRKSPKQCKARWYEWLDPSIKKVEWSKTEDEKLLHLAKLMPTQWRTIAPIVGRTATQCLERYQKLLDDAEAKDNDELGLGSGENPEAQQAEGSARTLKAGEIDTDPETRAARPDPIDMDDDEKEMLSEARARLANTQGKKAKRKARERQLEEAKRLAFLQKKRELKAAGINLRPKTKKKGMDYNADIPLEKRAAPGFYDTTEEQAKTYSAPIGQSLRALEGKRKQELEEQEEKNKRRRGEDGGAKPKNQAAQFVQAREAQIKKLKEQEQIIRRRRLNLPMPQVGERELEDIVKIGQAGEAAREMVGGNDEGASGRLLGDYDTVKGASMSRTPRTAPEVDNIMAEARNLRNMTSTQTPLLGQENTPLPDRSAGGTGYESATPRRDVAATPNPLATPRTGAGAGVAGGPMGQTPMRTPMRDSLSINDATPGYGATPLDEKRRLAANRRSLKAGFAALPTPENNFELAEDEDDEVDEDGEPVVLTEEDAAERDARLKAAREEEERRELERRSTVVKLSLPRPVNVNERQILAQLEANGEDDEGLSKAVRMINLEVAALMKHDSIAHPLPGSSAPPGLFSEYDQPEDEFVSLAKTAIHSELAGILGLPGANPQQVKLAIIADVPSDISAAEFSASWASERAGLILHPNAGLVETTSLNPTELASAYAHTISLSRERMIAAATTAAKGEKKLARTLGGYQALHAKARAGIVEAINEIHATKRELETFLMLKSMEEAAVPARLERKREEVATLERREAELQERYAVWNDERRERVAAIEQLEEDKTVLQAQMALDGQANGDAGMDGDE